MIYVSEQSGWIWQETSLGIYVMSVNKEKKSYSDYYGGKYATYLLSQKFFRYIFVRLSYCYQSVLLWDDRFASL